MFETLDAFLIIESVLVNSFASNGCLKTETTLFVNPVLCSMTLLPGADWFVRRPLLFALAY